MITNDPRLLTPQLQEQLIDALTALAPLIGRLHVTARQQEQDARRAMDCLERAIGVLEALRPTTGGRS